MNQSQYGRLDPSLSMFYRLETAFRIGTLNVRGLTARNQQVQLKRLLIENDVNILALQESKIESEEQADGMVDNCKAEFNVWVCHVVGKSGGCVIFLKRSIGIIEESVITSQDGRLALCDFSLHGKKWRIICVYAPNTCSDRKCFFDYVGTFLKCDRIVVLLGDF